MKNVTIEVYPAHTRLSRSLAIALERALAHRKQTLNYKKQLFKVEYTPDGRFKEIKVVLSDINAPLPPIFTTELMVCLVVARCAPPLPLGIMPGRYLGEHYGFPGATCFVDPTGKISEGHPQIYASGAHYSNVVGLFKRALATRARTSSRRGW